MFDRPIRNCLPLAALCAALLSATAGGQVDAPAQTPPSADTRAMYRVQHAIDALEAGDAQAALRHLDKALAEAPQRSLARHAAQIMQGQLTGGFDERMSSWRNRQVADRVVLVPDERSFIAAVEQWTDDTFWPVLIEEAWFAPIFVAAFDPARVVRWDAPDEQPKEVEFDLEAAFKQAIVRQNESVRLQLGAAAPGLVVVDPAGLQRAGGLALAHGRGQPLAAHQPEKAERDTLNHEQASKINAAIMAEADKWNVLSEDAWCGITLAGPYPYRYNPPQPDDPKAPKPPGGPYALDDLLGRTSQGVRLAVVGRLTGGPAQSAYMAMCSLFLRPAHFLLADDYSRRNADNFVAYRMTDAARLLQRRLRITHLHGKLVNLRRFRDAVGPGSTVDMVWLNSSGGSKNWAFGGGGTPLDIPMGKALAYHVIHSYSAANVWDEQTIGGRAIAGGGYWYFGAIHEPYLNAFVPPTALALRAMAGTPLAFAARHLPGHPMYRPWKTMLIGDPLFSLRVSPATRVQADAIAGAQVVAAREGEPLIARFRDAALSGDPAAVRYAAQALQTPDELSNGDLLLAAVTIHNAGAGAALSTVQPDVAARHPLVKQMVEEHTVDLLDRQLRTDRIDLAQETLVRYFRIAADKKAVNGRLKRYMVEMAKSGREAQAISWLREQAKRELPKPARAAIGDMIRQIDQPTPATQPADEQQPE